MRLVRCWQHKLFIQSKASFGSSDWGSRVIARFDWPIRWNHRYRKWNSPVVRVKPLLLKFSKFSEVSYVIVSESGAATYSASELARQEFLITVENVQPSQSLVAAEPLPRLVKIDPQIKSVNRPVPARCSQKKTIWKSWFRGGYSG